MDILEEEEEEEGDRRRRKGRRGGGRGEEEKEEALLNTAKGFFKASRIWCHKAEKKYDFSARRHD